MKTIARTLSFAALGFTLAPACLFLADKITLPQAQFCMLIAAIAWFATAPLWMEHKVGD
jgi:hypothetical protein